MHFHSPSEHTIDGDSFDAELHIVCEISTAVTGTRNFLVVDTMFEQGAKNDFFEKL